MEMGSSSLNGLTFGEKIYFEDVGCGGGGGTGGAGGGGSSSRAPQPVVPARKGKGVLQGGPRCQVDGCKMDLSGVKAYYCRHKVCGMHSKAPMVIVAGREQRFCQQCSRFHQLSEFDEGKRSCRRRLAGHNERRRKPPPGPIPRFGRFSSSFREDSSGYRGFLMDFTYPRPPGPPRDLWPSVRASDWATVNPWHGSLGAHGTYVPCPNSELPPGQCFVGGSDSSCALSLLSAQPWATSASRNRAMSLSTYCGFDGTPMTQPLMSSSMNNPWGFKGHGASGSSHEFEQGMGHGHAMDGGTYQHSGELELAQQGNRHCPDLGPNRAYDHTGHGLHWSL